MDYKDPNARRAFTLAELVIVISIICVLLAIFVPGLLKSRHFSKLAVCQSNLKEIAAARHAYLDNNYDKFLQRINANLNYGGWRGIKGQAGQPDSFYPPYRPLNPYLSLPTDLKTGGEAQVFLCPSDRGGMPGALLHEKVYRAIGTSYQTNLFLIGPDRCGAFNSRTRPLDTQISQRLPNMTRLRACRPSLLLLIGDYGWVNQWDPNPYDEDVKTLAEWHDREDRYNLAFLDGHVSFLEIRKGYYVTNEYSVLPFEDLYDLAYEVQGPVE